MKAWTEVHAIGHIVGIDKLDSGTQLRVDIGQPHPLVVVIPEDHQVPAFGTRIEFTIHLPVPVEAG